MMIRVAHNREGKAAVRWLFLLPLIAALLLLGCGGAAAEAGISTQISDYSNIGEDYAGIDLAAISVFYVEIYQNSGECLGSGSGFVMFDEGLLITNQHVIDGADYLWIVDDDGKMYRVDQVVVSDRQHDIAILYFEEGRRYRSLEYDTAFDQLKRGQPVLAIGSPKGFQGTVSDGIISAFPWFADEDIRYIQITAPISHGSSGGCLLNRNLKVIGVTSAGVDEGQNIGFAIPVFIVEQLYRQWDKTQVIALGSESSWDTVGSGLHSRIYGTLDRPQVSADNSAATEQPSAPAQSAGQGAEQPSAPVQSAGQDTGLPPAPIQSAGQDTGLPPAPIQSAGQNAGLPPAPIQAATQAPAATPEPVQPAAAARAYLELVWDPDKPMGAGYALAVNGSKLDWQQTVQQAAQFCTANGVEMAHFDQDVNDDAYYTGEEELVVFNTIPLQAGFYVRKAANSTALNQIDLDVATGNRPEDVIASAVAVYQQLKQRYGTPDDGVRIYTGEDFVDAGTDDLAAAVRQMMQYGADYCFVSVDYGNLSLYVVCYTELNMINVTLSLSIWG